MFITHTFNATSQIFTQNALSESIIITPKGLQGKTNSGSVNSNVALGTNSLNANTSGYENTANGFRALERNTTGFQNTANGYLTLYTNTTGMNNTATGASALANNTYGSENSAHGNLALRSTTSGIGNTANGWFALEKNTTGYYNTSCGAYTGYNTVTGNSNTFLGNYANASSDYSNTTAIGAFASVNADNKVRIGNANVTAIEGQVAWSNPSDRRLKENIVYTNRLGLDFIYRLKTVSYNYIDDKNKTRYDGFIAQDIEQTMKELQLPFSGLKKSGDGIYSLAYSDFVMPLVNAVKEQQEEINVLKKQIEELKKLFLEVKRNN